MTDKINFPKPIIHKRTLREKKEVLKYYLLEKQLKFRDSIQDDTGVWEEGQSSEAEILFNDPFQEERDLDNKSTLDRDADGLNLKDGADDLITGGYRQDIVQLMDTDIIEDPCTKDKDVIKYVKKNLAENMYEEP